MRYLTGLAAAAGFLCSAADAGSAQDIKMWTLVTEGYPEFVKEAEAAFEQSHPGVHIIYETFPNEAYKTQIQVALTGSEPPDVFFNWSGEDAARLVRDGLVVDLTDYGKKPGGFAENVSAAWLSAFAYDGRNYGVPTDAVSKYFYYDPVFFEEHGLKPPETFDGLLQLCRDIRKVDPALVPWPLGNSERWKLIHVMTMLNQRILGSKTTAPDYALTASDDQLFTNAGYVEAWQKVVDLMDAGCFQDAPNATSPEASRSMFAAQVSPMIYCGTWCAAIFNTEGYDGYKMFRFPVVEGGAGDPGGQFLVPQGLMVSAKSKNPELAAEWINFVVSDEQAANFAQDLGAIPSNPAMIDKVQGTEQYKWIVNDVSQVTEPANVLDVLLEASVSNAYLDAGVEILNRTMTPEQAMQKIRQVALDAKHAQKG